MPEAKECPFSGKKCTDTCQLYTSLPQNPNVGICTFQRISMSLIEGNHHLAGLVRKP